MDNICGLPRGTTAVRCWTTQRFLVLGDRFVSGRDRRQVLHQSAVPVHEPTTGQATAEVRIEEKPPPFALNLPFDQIAGAVVAEIQRELAKDQLLGLVVTQHPEILS